ncbi:Trypanosomal VSG domain containing protein [Trypanosoma brucei equiperdum]|uniref:Trypanosomal VSG domain containing protein n=1 Tax=Trypanosoma brucei equiperdum TaxID=630700 RepID=A0A3L6KTL8_9TRYP|nr:Trypanosomal VSG domain containing protein [Trypanosoma brucei equiperdum]
MRYPTLAIIFIVAGVRRAKDNIDDGENTPVFSVLCKLVQLAQAGAPGETEEVAVSDVDRQLVAINMSLSDQTWQNKFAKPSGEPIYWASEENKDKQMHPEWESDWVKWALAKQEIKMDGTQHNELKKAGFLGPLTNKGFVEC